MALDTITCELKDGSYTLKVFKEEVLDEQKAIDDPAFQAGCFEAQISDLMAGMDSNPDTKDEVLALIANYEEAITCLKAK